MGIFPFCKKIHYCKKCDAGLNKEVFGNHLIRYPFHKTELIIFDSEKEFGYFRELQLRKRSGDIKDYEIKPVLKVFHNPISEITYVCWSGNRRSRNDKLCFSYEADFLVNPKEGNDVLIIDVKGKAKKRSKKTGKYWTSETAVFRLKKKILKALMVEVIVK